ncbi:hypothetical protein [Candidatus Pelagibacter communis]|uniref:hypothetical protein n=1 Tax=Candidatus Pelagibacter TaxID=198251 RepID=UPI003EE1C176
MKIYDTTTYYEEDLMMDLRFNILNEYVDKFIVCEANFSHSGQKKEIKFDPNNFKKFKDKIIHIIVDKDPVAISKNYNSLEQRFNSIKRIEFQRNKIFEGLNDANPNDLIIYSDNDEIPKLENINFKKINSKIILFRQKLYYYKFNLHYDKLSWYGSKACRFKNLKNVSWLRNIKTKKYNFFRIDTLFSSSKYIDLKIIENGGWHFTNLKSPRDLLKKYLNDEMHSEFEQHKVSLAEIENKILNGYVNYDHMADSKKSSSQKQNNQFKLNLVGIEDLPEYIKKNLEKYKSWIV